MQGGNEKKLKKVFGGRAESAELRVQSAERRVLSVKWWVLSGEEDGKFKYFGKSLTCRE